MVIAAFFYLFNRIVSKTRDDLNAAHAAFIAYLTTTASKDADRHVAALDKLTERIEAGERRAEARHEALMGMFRQKVPTGDGWRFPEEG